eukprot:CAMPEP_0184669192 /NCGR_PEP_ID=MMETSP0308-20130426/76231_1 /TAXON_ID=38269 /ORGANISM="Gloeochaete witrockiana, Strain SAG 46.84" /LENGTH=608 /DNA_ID=CAMNT_0027115331 /DNA_START=242 /DNA_END=2068 /DNA_ORIENTATION=-
MEVKDALISVGMSPYEMNECERHAFPQYASSQEMALSYLGLRNSIVKEWMSDCTQYLPVSALRDFISDKDITSAMRIYSFLERYGFINVGAYESPRKPISKQQTLNGTVLVIGAGMAGVAAGRHLSNLGFEVTILEARQRVGGRICSDLSLGGTAVDLGAMIVVGTVGNPITILCKQLGLSLYPLVNNKCPIYDFNGNPIPSDVDDVAEKAFNEILDACSRMCNLYESRRRPTQAGQEVSAGSSHSSENGKQECIGNPNISIKSEQSSPQPYPNVKLEPTSEDDGLGPSPFLNVSLGAAIDGLLLRTKKDQKDLMSGLERRVFEWHRANLEYGCGTELSQVSLPYWSQDDAFEYGGDHCLVPGGYGRVVAGLANGLRILFDHIVEEIRYGVAGCEVVVANKGTFRADRVCITVPLGCLKDKLIKFSPPLPDWKETTIRRLGYGLLNKVILSFPSPFWELWSDFFGRTHEDPERRGEFYLFISLQRCTGRAILIVLAAGKASYFVESAPNADVVESVMRVLRNIFGEKTPDPVGSIVTRWRSDPYARGSYSYVAIGSSGDDYDLMAKPLSERVFFAGEATDRQHPATVSGAYASGVRQAALIAESFGKM